MRAAGLLLLIPLLLLVPCVSAHADLQTATPAPGGHADEGIAVVEFVFTEDVERQFTTANVIDESGESVAAGPVEFDDAAHNVIRLPVKPLASGVYSASWKALSVDTHTTRGLFLFSVGNATLSGPYDPVVDDATDESPGAIARDGFARFAFYTGLFLAIGMPLFALVVLREAPPRTVFATAASFGVVGAAGAAVGLLFLAQRTDLGMDVLGTVPGDSLVRRGAFLLAASVAVLVAAARPEWWRPASLAAVLLGGASIYYTSKGSHAAALRESTSLYIAADAVHLVAAAVWIGGIVAFLHVMALRDGRSLSELVYRFTAIAIPSVALLLATGTFASIAHMPCFDEGVGACLREAPKEPYMRLVALKLALMGPLVLLGAFNALFMRERLASGSWSRLRFRRVVQAEAVLLAVVVGAAGVLAAGPPPDQEVVEGTQPPPAIFEVQNFTGKSHVILQITPNPVRLGDQELIVIVHPLGAQLPNSTLVALKIYPATSEEPEETILPTKITPNEWQLQGSIFATPETWKVTILLQRPDDDYRKLTFEVPVVNPAAPAASSTS